jgi:hypothetical protein
MAIGAAEKPRVASSGIRIAFYVDIMAVLVSGECLTLIHRAFGLFRVRAIAEEVFA